MAGNLQTEEESGRSSEVREVSANLLTFTVDLTTQGDILLYMDSVLEGDLVRVLDEWNGEYQNTHSIAAIVRHVKERVLNTMDDLTSKESRL